ncbi:hypothetical protein D3C75_528600 [compost metagenome]
MREPACGCLTDTGLFQKLHLIFALNPELAALVRRCLWGLIYNEQRSHINTFINLLYNDRSSLWPVHAVKTPVNTVLEAS